jgi:hypothetical protein
MPQQQPPRQQAPNMPDDSYLPPIDEEEEEDETVSFVDDGEETAETWDKDIGEEAENIEPRTSEPEEDTGGEEPENFEPEIPTPEEEPEGEIPLLEFGGETGEFPSDGEEVLFGDAETENLEAPAETPAGAEEKEKEKAEMEAEKPPEFEEPKTEAPENSPEKENKLTKSSIIDLMKYLKGLAGDLPDTKRENFMKSDARLSMEYVINTLDGKEGLFKGVRQKKPERRGSDRRSLPAGGDRRNPYPDREKVAGTLSYLGELSSGLSDKNLFAALKQKVQRIMARIKNVTDKRKKDA